MSVSVATSEAQVVLAIGRQRYVTSGFVVARTPLLALSDLTSWGEGLSACADLPVDELEHAIAADRRLLRTRLAAIVQRPEVAQALFLASPDLDERIPRWLSEPECDAGQRLERSLVRYFIRMCSRPTPFGLFAGCSLGRVGGTTSMRLARREACRRHTRLDMDYLARLVAALEREPSVRERLRYRTNNSLYEASGRIRYVESRVEKRGRSHHLVAIEPSPYVRHVVDSARTGRSCAELVDALLVRDPELEREDAAAFVHQLIDMQVLVSELELRVTGDDVAEDLRRRLAAMPETAMTAERLGEVAAALAGFDRALFATRPAEYRRMAEGLASLPASVELKTLVQVDLFKPVEELSIGDDVLREIARGTDVALRFGRPPEQSALKRFARDFRARYEDAAVPLMEALDEEIGVGFQMASSPEAEGSPLLAKLPFRAGAVDENVPWGFRETLLLEKYAQSLTERGAPVELTRDDVERTRLDGRPPLPDSVSVMGTLLAHSAEAVGRGEFRVRLNGLFGPSGVRLLGRFCRLSEALESAVIDHLREEERHRPDALYAEIVHLPDGRAGNILFRPVLRPYEIPFLARAGVPDERCIPVTDLMVRVAGERIVLVSKRLGREVIPRISNAHNVSGTRLGIYRFLGAVQGQGLTTSTGWNWGPLANAPFLPRVVSGKVILATARWLVGARQVKVLAEHSGARAYAAVQAWRAEHRVPRWIELVEGGDNALLLDLENAAHVDVFLHELRARRRGEVLESLEHEDVLCASSPEGRFTHELVIPLVRVPEQEPGALAHRAAIRLAPDTNGASPASGRFTPGSDWLFAKLYCGTSDADGLLREQVAPLVDEVLGSGAAQQWFFIRYSDPDWHLRLRFRGEPARLTGEVLPAIRRHLEPKLADGGLRRLVFDTYDREIDRYGGREAVEPVERYFEADSRATLQIVRRLAGDRDADVRWRLAYLGVDRLLDEFGIGTADRLRLLKQMRDALWEEFAGHKGLTIRLGDRYREERAALRTLLDPRSELSGALQEGRAALERRRDDAAPSIARLRELDRTGALGRPLGEVVLSLVHMHMNRMLRSAARAHELVVYDFLGRAYDSALAADRRANSNGKPGANAAAGGGVGHE